MTPARTRTMTSRVSVAVGAVLLVRLLTATVAPAQTRETDAEPVAPWQAAFGGTVAATIVLPDFGLIASIPIARRVAVEVNVARMPPFLDDGPGFLVGQAQVRVPFRERPHARRSLLVGLTSISRFHGGDGFFGSSGAFVRPHLGVSWQRPVGGTAASFRFDVQGIASLDHGLPVIPRMVAAWVVHPGTRRR